MSQSHCSREHKNPQPAFKYTRIGPNSSKLIIKLLAEGSLQISVSKVYSYNI